MHMSNMFLPGVTAMWSFLCRAGHVIRMFQEGCGCWGGVRVVGRGCGVEVITFLELERGSDANAQKGVEYADCDRITFTGVQKRL